MTRQLIDTKGNFLEASSEAVRGMLGAHLAGGDLSAFAVRNLGFVLVERSDGNCSVRLRPRLVHPVAFSSAVNWIADQTASRFMVSSLDSTWHHHLLASREDVIAKLVQLYPVADPTNDPRFLTRELPVASLSAHDPLGCLLRRWRELEGQFNRERMTGVLDHILEGRYFLATKASRTDDLVIGEVGPGLVYFNRDLPTRLEGFRVEDMPDVHYGRFVAQSLLSTLTRAEPIYDEVDARLSLPRKGTKAARYRRISLPFKAADGGSVLLSASLFDNTINLRV
jgi:hypothetical protein